MEEAAIRRSQLAIPAALGQLGIETMYLKETLPEEKRRPFTG